MSNNKVGIVAIGVIAAVGLFIYHKSMVKKNKPIVNKNNKKENIVKPNLKVETIESEKVKKSKDLIVESLDSIDILKSIEEFETKILQDEKRIMANEIYKFIGNLYMENELAKTSVEDDGLIIEEKITRVIYVDELPDEELTFEFEEVFEF